MINKIKLKLFGLLSYILSFVLKDENKLWIIGAGNGYTYTDNSRYFYEWINKNKNKDKKVFWVTKNPSIFKMLKKNKELNIIYFYSFKGIILLAKAKVYICSHGIDDITPYVNKSKVVICLWHGLPIKKIGNMAMGVFGKSNRLNSIISALINSKKNYDLFLTPSQYYKNIFEESFGAQINNYLLAQYPRVTELKEKYKKSAEDNRIGTILFAPTFRDFVNQDYYESMGILPPLDYLNELNVLLSKNNYRLIIKLHPYINIRRDYINGVDGFNNITFADKNEDVLNLLIYANVLITDYSSIYFDFMALNKEIFFLMPDYDIYKNNVRGFNFDFEKIAPGKIYSSWYDIANHLQYRNIKFEPDDKYAYFLEMSNGYEMRTNQYIYNEIEKQSLMK
jgi:CDP-glycerol glycerophosphotransferase (TagB/SpsB family)